MAWLADTPLALIGLTMVALLLAALEAGYRGLGWLRRRRAEPSDAAAPDHLLSAMLGLLALLLGFTFSLALTRYEARRELVVQEANAIGTTWLRARLIEAPERGQLLALLRRYADARVQWSQDESPRPSLAPTAALQARLWEATGTAVRHDSSAQLSRALMDAMNESFDLASARAAARAAHIPDEVLLILLTCALLSAVMLGNMMAARPQQYRSATTMLLMLLGLAMLLIFDLDRPVSGAITISQQPLVDQRDSMTP